MKTDIHPDYHAIVFRDLASGETFLTPRKPRYETMNSAEGRTEGYVSAPREMRWWIRRRTNFGFVSRAG